MEKEPGDVLGALARNLPDDRDMGAGSEHDTGMAEPILNDLEVGPDLQSEAGRVVPQISAAGQAEVR